MAFPGRGSWLLAVGLSAATPAHAAEAPDDPRRSIHFQATVIEQGHRGFHSPYSGPNSLRSEPESAASITATLFLGLRLRPGTEVYADPELSGGRGMSGARGVAGFPNGETFRIGDPSPVVSLARLFVRQTLGLGGGTEQVPDGLNQLPGSADARRLTVAAGKFGIADSFDNNAYSHDPRTQFMNWALMNSAAWDYPADTRGYTWGLSAELRLPDWALRAAAVAEPKQANMLDMDRRIGRAHGFALEGERQVRWGERKGAVRLLAFLNEAPMGSYEQALAAPAGAPDVAQTRLYGRTKYGFASSSDLELAEHLGGFLRLSWNDGRNETWAYTEIDASQAMGLVWTPAAWGRAEDSWGLAAAVNELSGPHRRYLAAGGSGFMLGDGGLHYGPELIAETYYRFQALKALSVSPDAQLVCNPGYNRSRGPVPVWGLRVHAEF